MNVHAPSPARRFWNLAYLDGDHRRFWEDSLQGAEARIAGLGLDPVEGPILDLGCGAGLEMLALARRGAPALGLDLALAGLAAARRRGRREGLTLRLGCADATALPLGDGSVALVIDRGCFHQLGGRARKRYGSEVARVLAPGGRLVLWGARSAREDEGVVGLSRRVLAAAFPSPWRVVESKEVVLAAPAGDLPGRRVVLLEG